MKDVLFAAGRWLQVVAAESGSWLDFVVEHVAMPLDDACASLRGLGFKQMRLEMVNDAFAALYNNFDARAASIEICMMTACSASAGYRTRQLKNANQNPFLFAEASHLGLRLSVSPRVWRIRLSASRHPMGSTSPCSPTGSGF